VLVSLGANRPILCRNGANRLRGESNARHAGHGGAGQAAFPDTSFACRAREKAFPVTGEAFLVSWNGFPAAGRLTWFVGHGFWASGDRGWVIQDVS